MNIGIIGLGMVGKQVFKWFKDNPYADNIFTYDIANNDNLVYLNEAEIIFICIPTPYRKACSKGVDIAPFMDLIGYFEKSKAFVIKSTIPIGFTESLQKEYPEHKILHNPEFLSEKTAYYDFIAPNIQIIGHTPGNRGIAAKIAHIMPKAPILRIVDSKVSEMYKLMRNSYLATKVTFFNDMFNICEQTGIAYNDLHEIIQKDVWIGANHTVVNHKGYRGFGGKCLPKDIEILTKYGTKSILKDVSRHNRELLISQGMGSQLDKWIKGVK